MSGENTTKLNEMCSIKKALLSFAVQSHMEKADQDVKEFFNLVNSAAAETVRALQRELAELKATRDERVSRLRIKNGNYRLGMKQLQRAHEQLLHRYNALKRSTELKTEVQEEAILSIQKQHRPEPGYDDYFRQRVVNGNIGVQREFQGRAQSADVLNTRL